MKLFLFSLISFLVSSPELVVYTNDDYLFEVQFPKEYKEEKQSQEEKFGSTEFIKLSGREGSISYTAVATRYKSNGAFEKSGANFQELVSNHAKSVNQESFIRNNFVILAENHRKDVLEYVVGNLSTEVGMIRRIYIRKGMTYSLSIMGNKDLLKQEIVEPFFKSFKSKLK